MKLTACNVERLFAECFREAGETTEGVMGCVALDVAGREADIEAMLAQLPDEFQAAGGGGWSFLNACMDRGGGQWTGMHPTMDKLFMLGIAAGKARFLLPRDLWSALPGGMPYVVVN
ncbi:hypothetical protein ACUSIJ_24695 [Pseudochelatococcus sp. B33]